MATLDGIMDYLADESINDHIDTIQSYIDLDGYTSQNNKYTFPCDGFIQCAAGTSATSQAGVRIYGATDDNIYMDFGIRSNSTYPSMICYVRKGMRVYVSMIANSGHIRFYPLR